MKIVSAGIIRNNNTVLLARRSPGEVLSGYWEFPGGKQEANESIYECLIRELQEELSITVETSSIFAESIYHYDGGSIKLVAIEAIIISGIITPIVHDKVEWVSLDNLSNFMLAPADISIANELHKRWPR